MLHLFCLLIYIILITKGGHVGIERSWSNSDLGPPLHPRFGFWPNTTQLIKITKSSSFDYLNPLCSVRAKTETFGKPWSRGVLPTLINFSLQVKYGLTTWRRRKVPRDSVQTRGGCLCFYFNLLTWDTSDMTRLGLALVLVGYILGSSAGF